MHLHSDPIRSTFFDYRKTRVQKIPALLWYLVYKKIVPRFLYSAIRERGHFLQGILKYIEGEIYGKWWSVVGLLKNGHLSEPVPGNQYPSHINLRWIDPFFTWNLWKASFDVYFCRYYYFYLSLCNRPTLTAIKEEDLRKKRTFEHPRRTFRVSWKKRGQILWK